MGKWTSSLRVLEPKYMFGDNETITHRLPGKVIENWGVELLG